MPDPILTPAVVMWSVAQLKRACKGEEYETSGQMHADLENIVYNTVAVLLVGAGKKFVKAIIDPKQYDKKPKPKYYLSHRDKCLYYYDNDYDDNYDDRSTYDQDRFFGNSRDPFGGIGI